MKTRGIFLDFCGLEICLNRPYLGLEFRDNFKIRSAVRVERHVTFIEYGL